MPGASRWRPCLLLAGPLFWSLATANADIATTCMARELAQGCGQLATRGGNITLPPPWARLIHAEALCEGGVDLTGPDAPPAATGTYLVSPSLQGFKRRLGAFEQQNGLRYNIVTFSDMEYLNRRYRFTDVLPTAADPGSMDFWSLSAEVFGMPEAVSSFLDTTLLLFSDSAYGAADIPSDWRAAMSSASTGSYCSIPGTVLPTHMYYRTDIFAVHNISVPATWDELLTVAEAFHGRDMDGDGLPEYGICMDTREVCGQYGDTLLMVLATLVQTRGPTDGVVFDPDNLSLLATGEALAKAIQIYRGLIRFGPPPDTPCRSFYTQLLPQGRCLVAFGVPLAFKVASHASVPSRVSGGKLGTAPLPGSERVLDRPSGRLVPCTPERCPYAQRVARLEGGSSAQEVLANTVVAMDSISFAINRYSPPYRQAAAFRMLATLMSPAQQQERILAVNTEGGPFRASQLNLGAWVNAGYDPANARSFLAAYRAVLESPNVFYELRFPGVLRFKDALFQLARAVLWGNVSLAATDAEFRVAVTTVIQQQGGKEVFLAQYRKTLGIVEQKKRAGDEEDKVPHTHASKHVVAIVISVAASVLVAVAVLVALVAFVRLRQRRRAAAAQGQRLDAPGPGVAVLCITDIESSTCLWETLTADVCQAAVSLHHAVIRTAAQQHRGYESATEGDSFILAFRSSLDCLRFCLRVQEALLALDWPPELLDSPYAATLAVRHDPAGMQPWVRRAVGPSLRPLLRPPGAAKRNDAGPSDSRQAQRPAATSANGRRPVINSPAQPSGVGPSGSGSGSGAQDCPGIMLASHRTARTCSSPVAPAGLLAAASEGQGRRAQSLGQHTLLGSIPQQLQVVQPQDFPGAMLSPDDIWLLGTTGEFSALTGCEESRPGPQPSPDLKSLLSACWEETSSQVGFSAEPQDDARLLFRGLRVRMGFHRGVLGSCDVNTNQASQRVVYSGPVLQLARAIGDVGRGGQVLMSTAALASLNPQQLTSEAAVVLHSGRHMVKLSDSSSVELYSVFGQGLLPRTVFMEPPRSHTVMAPGVLEAPLGRLAVAVVQVEELGGLGPQGVMGLYGTLRAQAQHLAAELKGYLLLTGPGALQAVFHDPAAAARWCLQLVVSVQSLRPGRGLQQGADDREQKAEVAEEHLSADPEATGLSMRGGVDVGNIEAGLTFDGRLSYKGPAFKAAGSLAAHANWSEILVSGTLANAILGKCAAPQQPASLHATLGPAASFSAMIGASHVKTVSEAASHLTSSGASLASAALSFARPRPLSAAWTAVVRPRSQQQTRVMRPSAASATTTLDGEPHVSRHRRSPLSPLDVGRDTSTTASPFVSTVTCERSPRSSIDAALLGLTRSGAALRPNDVSADGFGPVGPVGTSMATERRHPAISERGMRQPSRLCLQLSEPVRVQSGCAVDGSGQGMAPSPPSLLWRGRSCVIGPVAHMGLDAPGERTTSPGPKRRQYASPLRTRTSSQLDQAVLPRVPSPQLPPSSTPSAPLPKPRLDAAQPLAEQLASPPRASTCPARHVSPASPSGGCTEAASEQPCATGQKTYTWSSMGSEVLSSATASCTANQMVDRLSPCLPPAARRVNLTVPRVGEQPVAAADCQEGGWTGASSPTLREEPSTKMPASKPPPVKCGTMPVRTRQLAADMDRSASSLELWQMRVADGQGSPQASAGTPGSRRRDVNPSQAALPSPITGGLLRAVAEAAGGLVARQRSLGAVSPAPVEGLTVPAPGPDHMVLRFGPAWQVRFRGDRIWAYRVQLEGVQQARGQQP